MRCLFASDHKHSTALAIRVFFFSFWLHKSQEKLCKWPTCRWSFFRLCFRWEILNKKNLKQKFFGPKRVSLSPAQSDTSCCPDYMWLYWAHYMLSSMILAMVTGGQLIDLDGLSMTRAGKLVDAGFLQGNDVTLCCCCRFGWFEHLIILFNGAERFLMRRAGKLKASWWPGSFLILSATRLQDNDSRKDVCESSTRACPILVTHECLPGSIRMHIQRP